MSKVFTSWKIQGKLLIIAEEDDLHSLLQAGADVESIAKKAKVPKITTLLLEVCANQFDFELT